MRVSTKEKDKELAKKDREQTFERQKGILERAGYTLTADNTFAERISGKTKADERKVFERMLSVLHEKDYVVFTETSRFSRSYLLGMQMLDTLIFDKKVNVKFISNGIELFAGVRFNPYVWYTISQMLLADELQRRVISYNTANGLQAKKAQGVILGAPKSINDNLRQRIFEMSGNNKSYRSISQETGVSIGSISRILKEVKNG